MVPRVSRTFRQNEQLGFFLQVYPAAMDASTGRPDLKLEFAIAPKGSAPERWRDCTRLALASGSRATLARLTSLEPFPPGDYVLAVRAEDRIAGETVQATAAFSILPK